MFLSETGLGQSIPVEELVISSYLPLILKQDPLNCHGVYIKNDSLFGRDPTNDFSSDFV